MNQESNPNFQIPTDVPGETLTVSEWFPEFSFQDTEDPVVQLENGLRFLRSHNHGKHMFNDGKGGYCQYGALVAGNGFPSNPKTNVMPPFTGEMAKLNKAGHYLESVIPGGGVMMLNDTNWMNKDFSIALYQEAIDLAKSEAEVENLGNQIAENACAKPPIGIPILNSPSEVYTSLNLIEPDE